MDTVKLPALNPPSPLDLLLRELVQSLNIVPEGAYEVGDRTSLPPALRRLARHTEHTGQSWACWLAESGHKFFMADMPSSLSSERGKPVLRINQYGGDGAILYTGQWVEDPSGKWVRCTPARCDTPDSRR